MCLDRLAEFKTTGEGWKVVNPLEEKNGTIKHLLCAQRFNIFFGTTTKFTTFYNKNEWNYIDQSVVIDEMIASCDNPTLTEKPQYGKGFHIFVNKKDAINAIKKQEENNRYLRIRANGQLKRVQYRDVIATGYTDNLKTVVAREFRFVPRKKKKVNAQRP